MSHEQMTVAVVVTPHGGHCGFIAEAAGGDDGYWAEEQIVAFAEKHCRI